MAPSLSDEIRKKIIELRQAGFRVSDICKETGVTRKTVYIWLNRWKQNQNLESKHRQNYERSTKPEEDEALIRAHFLDPNLTTRESAALFNISMDTVRRRLKEAMSKGTLATITQGQDHTYHENSMEVSSADDSASPADDSAGQSDHTLAKIQMKLRALAKKNHNLEKKTVNLELKNYALLKKNRELTKRNEELEKQNEALNAELRQRLLDDMPREDLIMAVSNKQKKTKPDVVKAKKKTMPREDLIMVVSNKQKKTKPNVVKAKKKTETTYIKLIEVPLINPEEEMQKINAERKENDEKVTNFEPGPSSAIEIEKGGEASDQENIPLILLKNSELVTMKQEPLDYPPESEDPLNLISVVYTNESEIEKEN